MPVREGITARALMALTLETTQAQRQREQRDSEMGLQEAMLQFQVEFSGTAQTTWGFASLELAFDSPFYYAPGQRDPDFDRPHFWFGAVVNTPIAVTAVVTGWSIDADNGSVIGATVNVGVCADAAGVNFDGVVHLTFQGFSALSEGGQEIDVDGG